MKFNVTTGFLGFSLVALLLSGCQSTPPRSSTIDMEDNTGGYSQTNRQTGAGEVYVQLAIAYMNKGQLDVALSKARQGLAVEPDNTTGHNVIALLYDRLGEKGLAEHHFQKGLALSPRNSYLLNAYGTFLCAQKRFDDANQQFTKALANPLYKTPEVALTNAGICARRIPDMAQAESYLRQALERNPRFAAALGQMAQISLQNGEHLSSRGYLQRYLEVSKHTAGTLWTGIQTERVLGDRDAVASYSLLLKNAFPDSREAQLLIESEKK
ncbi:MAG: type IV pilus biogenesis/stability protein PilW [Candidatus Sedimenticola sp. 20ELBAFRAG]